MRRLIVNADDFGFTAGVNRGVAELNRVGALSSATLMAIAPQFDGAVRTAAELPALGVGCHIVLVDGSPAESPEVVSSLLETSAAIDNAPRFRATLGAFVRDLTARRISVREMEREAVAQITRLQEAGIRVTHVDTHKHTHMFPPVLEAVTRAAVACGIGAIRNPFEPQWSLAAETSASVVRRVQVRALRGFLGNFQRAVRRCGLATTDGCAGVLATGTLDSAALRSLVSRMPHGAWELVCHPGYADDELRGVRTRLQQSREIELRALESLPGLLPPGTEMIHFGHLER